MSDTGDAPAVLRISTDEAGLNLLHPWLDREAQNLRLSKAMLNAMHLALEEAVMNLAMHAFAPGEHHEIVIWLHQVSDAIVLVVEDKGRFFDPAVAPLPRHPENLHDAEPGGLGLTLLRHFCQDIGYRQIGDRNQLSLRFPLPQT